MKNTLSITDNRTGKNYELPIENDTIRTADLRQIKVNESDFGMMGYDPAFMNTASCKSSISFIDGDVGILEHRGYPIEQLAEQCSYLESSYLLINGELPNQKQLDEWTNEIKSHTFIHENVKKLMEGFRYDAHPMGMFVSTIAALSTFYPESKNITDPDIQRKQVIRLIGKVPTVAAFCFRHIKGMPYVYPENDLSFTGNFLNMMFKIGTPRYEPHPIIEKALDTLFVLHIDHEQNCSTSAMRNVGSSHSDVYASTAAAAAALYGPLHGGANEEVVHMLNKINSIKDVPALIEKVKKGEGRLMGFGHRVYKNYDPRARVIKKLADKVFEVTGKSNKLEIALELEKIALSDEYFIKRKLYPNVDFYSGLIYQALGFPTEFFPVLFAIPRTSGWIAQWQEMLNDTDQKIVRPRQIYTGQKRRNVDSILRR